jgi:hypothetical protein
VRTGRPDPARALSWHVVELPLFMVSDDVGARATVIDEAKRIWSHIYLPCLRGYLPSFPASLRTSAGPRSADGHWLRPRSFVDLAASGGADRPLPRNRPAAPCGDTRRLTTETVRTASGWRAANKAKLRLFSRDGHGNMVCPSGTGNRHTKIGRDCPLNSRLWPNHEVRSRLLQSSWRRQERVSG